MIGSNVCNEEISVGERIKWAHLDAANTLSINDLDLHVALLAPGGSPGVLEDPVWSASRVSAVTGDEDGVIELGSAFSRVEDTAGVVLEDHLVSFDGDRDWLLGDGGLHLFDVVSGDFSVGGDVNSGG